MALVIYDDDDFRANVVTRRPDKTVVDITSAILMAVMARDGVERYGAVEKTDPANGLFTVRFTPSADRHATLQAGLCATSRKQLMEPKKSPKPEIKFFGLVRDKHGRPKIDGDPNDLAPEIKSMLTPSERAELGVK